MSGKSLINTDLKNIAYWKNSILYYKTSFNREDK